MNLKKEAIKFMYIYIIYMYIFNFPNEIEKALLLLKINRDNTYLEENKFRSANFQ